MAIIIKTDDEIRAMRESGKILSQILDKIEAFVAVGKSTQEIDDYTKQLMEELQVTASFKGYSGFPAHVCTSVNDQVVHTIPGEYRLQDGDIITVDCGVFHKGYHSDSARTFLIGNVDEKVKTFVEVIKKALYKGISVVKDGVPVRMIGKTIQNIVEKEYGYHIVKELTGHGIGKTLHEDPHVFNFEDRSDDTILKAGMTIAIEPIAAMGTSRIKTLSDGWTIVTKDGSPACQWEHTIVVTQKGAEILTQ